uniref:Uncharacterized protein n=1 Tax=Piliocolobus tephrosceles TaxID=591936 RepID=A0A8C9GTK4_9PRIM
MRSRRRFSTSGFSICDQREKESGPTGPRLSAAAPASDPAAGRARLPPRPQDPRLPRVGPIRSLSAPPPNAPRSVSVARLPGSSHSPLSVSSSLLPSLCLSSSFLSTLCRLPGLCAPTLLPSPGKLANTSGFLPPPLPAPSRPL